MLRVLHLGDLVDQRRTDHYALGTPCQVGGVLLVADDLAGGRLVAPWGFVETPGRLALWTGRADPRSERLAQWLRAELAGPAP